MLGPDLFVEFQAAESRACAAQQLLNAFDRVDLQPKRGQYSGLVTRTGPDFKYLAGIPVSIRASVIRATTQGCEMVCPLPIGNAVSS